MQRTLARIREGLEEAGRLLRAFTPGAVAHDDKPGQGPVTAADGAVDRALRRVLIRNREGWLSEETTDDPARLSRRRVWVVDPLDGTREFVAGIPEWCVSIALVEDGQPVAGGVLNPQTGEMFLGAAGAGVTYNGRAARATRRSALQGALVLASRSEVGRGEWDALRGSPFEVRAVGSVAYKLALVAAGRADATWTLVPKHEWDVAAGVALVRAGGGRAYVPDGSRLRFNRGRPLLPGLAAHGPGLSRAVLAELERLRSLREREAASSRTGEAAARRAQARLR